MGGSGSSLLDESKCTYIRGKTEAVIKNFSPHYKRQYAVAFCKDIQNELEQNRDLQSQFLKTKPPAESSMALYEGESLHFVEDLKKWKDRYIVIKNNYAVECFESKEAYQKGLGSKSCILPVGGKVLTTEEEYNAISDKHFPDPNGSSEKENSPAFVVLPKEFPVYLWQPFLRHNYFCFLDPVAQKQFSTVLNDCIRHLNHDFFKQYSFEAEAFLEAVQFFRQEKGHYGSWEMITGNEIQILSNLVMEELLPSLQSMLLPKLKGKRNDRKRAWFGIIEETYNLVQEQVSDGLHALKEECKEVTVGLEGTIRSNMDQIVTSKNFLAGKIKGTVSEPIQKCCGENIQPFLPSILEELMGPVSSGFSEVHLLFEKEVNGISQSFQATSDTTKLKENVNCLMSLPYNSVKMEPCYLKVNLLQEQLQDLKSRFRFHDIDLIIQKTQNLMQELLENAVYTFEQLLGLSHPRDTAKMVTAIEKVKLRVLKQYDYDSSTVRKKIFQDALVQISLPTMQRTLASTCKPMLQEYEQYIFAEHTNVIQVENVYEEILLQTLLDETLKVIREAAHLKKHNLYEEMNLPFESVSSLSDLKTPSGSTQASPARKPATNGTVVPDADSQSNDVFTPEKISQEECHETQKMVDYNAETSTAAPSIFATPVEKEIISDHSDNQEPPSVTYSNAEEQGAPQLPDVVTTSFGGSTMVETKVPVEEEKSSVPGGVDEIRNLLTFTVELPLDVSLESKENVLRESVISKPQECLEEREKDSKMNMVECGMWETQGLSKVPFPSSVEGNGVNPVKISKEESCITFMDSSEVPEELGVCQASKTELETKTSMWYTDVESGSTDEQSQANLPSEPRQSGQTEGIPPVHNALMDQISQVEQSAESRELDQEKEEPSSLPSVPMDDSSQVEKSADGDFQEAESSPLESAPVDMDAPAYSSGAVITEESILNIADLSVEPTALSVSPEAKKSECKNLETLLKTDNEALTLGEGYDPKPACSMSFECSDSASTTESATDRWENAEAMYPMSQSEK
nr:protein Niban [Pogona vitticeps]